MLDNEAISDSLICAIREGRLDRVRGFIYKYGLSYSTEWSEGYNILLEAVLSEHTMITKLLLSSGFPVNSDDKRYPLNTPLHFAVENGDMEIVQMLLDKGANIDSTGCDDKTVLHIAVERGYLKIVEILLKHGACVNTAYSKRDGTDCHTPLCVAVGTGNEDMIRLLLNQGANIDVIAKYSLSALHIAVKREHLKIIELLLEHGAYIDCTINLGPKRGYTPLCFAVDTGNEEMIKFLLSHGADINTTANNGVSPLHVAVAKGDLTILELLLRNVANDNSGYTSQCGNRYTPLHHAVEKGNEEIVKLLLSKGAKVDSKGSCGITPLHIAAKRGHLQIAKVLLKEGAYVDPVCRTIKCGGYTPLCYAVRNRHEKVVQLLLENGANVDSEDNKGNTILYTSVEKFKPVSLSIVQQILKYGPDIKHQSNKKAFKIALCKCEKEVVEIFLQFDFSVELGKSYNYHTMQYAAVENGYLRIVKQFLNKREEVTKLSKTHVADANAKNETANPSIIYNANPTQKVNPALLALAVKKEHKEIVELLLRHGADTNAIDTCGRTALHFTCINKNVYGLEMRKTDDVMGDIANLLLSWGADANVREGTFPILHVAVRNEYVEVVKALLEHNADVNSLRDFGMTPLHYCAETGNKVISKMLLNKGANVNAKLDNGITALHLAIFNGGKEVVEGLLNCGAHVYFGHESDSTPLHIAPDVNLGYGLDSTPLHMAARCGKLYIIYILLKFDVNIDTRDGSGKTPLHLACSGGYISIIEYLLELGSDINIKSNIGYLPIDYVGNHIHYNDPRQIIVHILHRHIIKLKTANLYVDEKNLMVTSLTDINDFQYKCNEEIARMKSEKINNANVSFFDILTKGTNRIALYAENEDILRVSRSDDYRIKFPIYANIIEHNFTKGKGRKRLLKECNKYFNFFFSYFDELPYTCKSEIFSYLSDNDLKILKSIIFERRKGLLEQGYRFFHFLFMSLPDFPYECTEKIFSYLSDEDLKILVVACKPANVSLQD